MCLFFLLLLYRFLKRKIKNVERKNKYIFKLFGNKDLPDYILERRNVVRMIVFTTIYSLVFINIFKPFNSEGWIPNSNSTNYLMYSSLMVVTGMVVISLSRIIMHYFVKKIQIGYTEYIVWLVVEAFMLAAFYVFIAYKVGFVDNYLSENKTVTLWVALFEIYRKAAANTLWMLLIPYAVALLYLDNEEVRRKLVETENRPGGKIIQFKDERGEIRFSAALENILYVEAADNYVNIKYVNNDKIADFVLRNKLKNVDEDMIGTPLRRCHRSYMINLVHVTSIKHDQSELVLEFDTTSIKGITVTKTYHDSILDAFMKYSGQKH